VRRQELCDACHDLPATVLTTSIVEGKAEVTRLCDACCKDLDPAGAWDSVKELREATCCFCGAVASVGGTDALSSVFGGEPRVGYKCFACSEELHRYMSAALALVPTNVETEKQVETIRSIYDEGERHMQLWVEGKKTNRQR
jgi:hypothetical protein